jgi:nucleoside-diphosphate-sugar epimerase
VNVLILGGTTFVGRHIGQACLEADHRVTIFVPASPDTPFQIVDGRDVGLAAVHALTSGLSGAFNIVNEPTTWKDWLGMSAHFRVGPRTPASAPNYVFADDQSWVEQQLNTINDPRRSGPLPMFLPSAEGWNLWRASNARSLATGIAYRPHRETIDDTLSWRLRDARELKAGLTAEQERRLITAWRERVGRQQ